MWRVLLDCTSVQIKLAEIDLTGWDSRNALHYVDEFELNILFYAFTKLKWAGPGCNLTLEYVQLFYSQWSALVNSSGKCAPSADHHICNCNRFRCNPTLPLTGIFINSPLSTNCSSPPWRTLGAIPLGRPLTWSLCWNAVNFHWISFQFYCVKEDFHNFTEVEPTIALEELYNFGF
jgi:hypothetical protein